MDGPAERSLLRSLRLYAIVSRVVLALATQAIALLVAPGPLRLSVAVLVATALWSATLLRRLRSPAGAGWLAADTALGCALGLAQPWIDSPALVGQSAGWVQMVVVTTVVTHQWQFPAVPVAGTAAAAAALVLAFGAGASLAVGPDPAAVLLPVVWIFLTGGISRLLLNSLRRAARRVDDASAALERDQGRAAVARARRAGELEHLAALHDTAAATLMMVGQGTVAAGEPWLRDQAGRDLRALRETPGAHPDGVVVALRTVARDSGLRVQVENLMEDDEPPVPVEAVTALAGAVSEALRNVRRHAGVDEASLVIAPRRVAGLRVEVRDRGSGVASSPIGSPGRGVRESIVRRMERAGGRARVAPADPGTLVELEWPGE